MTARPVLGRVRTALSAEGALLDADELLDVLWLAARLPPAAATALARAAGLAQPPSVPAANSGHQGAAPRTAPPPPGRDASDANAATSEPGPAGQAAKGTGLHSAPVTTREPSLRSERAAMAVRAPGIKALSGAELRLGRALRPLRQLRPDALRTELDIDATVMAMAETGLPEAVLRPATTRWLDLAVLVDDGVSMLLWQRLAGELGELLQRCGAFRHVRIYGLDTRGASGPHLRSCPYGALEAALPMSTVLDPAGHTLLLVVSDGVGRAWRDGSMHEALQRGASVGPTAVVHALPRRLWAGTGIDARPWRVTTRRRGAANRSWHIEDPLLPPELAPFNGLPVPVLTVDGDLVGTWAHMIGSPGDTALLPLLTLPPAASSSTPANGHRGRPISAEEAVTRFRDAASTNAYRLAAHLAAVAPLPVPVMRLVQHAVTPAVDTSHLAEVFLGGLMHNADAEQRPPNQRTFDFTEETRRILLGTVPPSDLVRTTRAVTAHLGELSGSPAGFPAWLPHPEGADRVAPDSRRPFGWVDQTLMRRLGVSLPDALEDDDEAAPRSDELRQLPPGLALDLDATQWRRLTVSDPRFEGRRALPYDVFAERAPGDSDVFLAHDGENNLLVIRRQAAHPDAHALTAREVLSLQRMDGFYAPRLMAWDPDHQHPWHAVQCALDEPAEPAPNLRDFPRRHGFLHHAGLLAVACQLAAGLARAHERGLIHGSLAASRVLIAGRDVQITGWTTASVDDVASRQWSHHHQNPRYRAPELTHATEPTRQGDVYALGCVLLDASTGPDHSGDWADALESAKRELQPGLVTILRSCLEHDPSRRPSAHRLAVALGSLRPQTSTPFQVSLGFDADLKPVHLDLGAETNRGNGLLLVQGRPAHVRRALLVHLLKQLAQQVVDKVEFVLADYDGRSGFDAFAQRAGCSLFLDLSRRSTDVVLSLCERLRLEMRLRNDYTERERQSPTGQAPERPKVVGLDRPPRMVVVVDDFLRAHRMVPELFSALRQVAKLGPRLGVQLIMSADQMAMEATDQAFISSSRIDLLSRAVQGSAPLLDGAVLRTASVPVPVHFSTGHESHITTKQGT